MHPSGVQEEEEKKKKSGGSLKIKQDWWDSVLHYYYVRSRDTIISEWIQVVSIRASIEDP